MSRLPIASLAVLLVAGTARAQPADDASPAARLDEVGRRAGGLRPTLRREGTSRGTSVRVAVPTQECMNVMVAVDPLDAGVRLRFGGQTGERTGEGIWEAQSCPGGLLPARQREISVLLQIPAGTRWALWAFPMPGLLGMLTTAPLAPPSPDVLARMAAEMPRYRARVRMADVATEGPLSTGQARRVLSILHRVIDCWRDPVETDPSLAGDRAVLFIVAPSGEVLAVTVSSPSDGPVGVRASECTTARLRHVRFPATEAGATSRVRAVLRVVAEQIAGGLPLIPAPARTLH